MVQKRAAFRTGDQALVRQINLSLVMTVLRGHAPISRASLAQITGLNKTTVSDLVAELLDAKFVCEIGSHSSGTGRPGTLLTLNPTAGCMVSCEIGVDFIEVLLADFAPQTIWRQREQIDLQTDQETRLKKTFDLLHKAVQQGREAGYPLLGVVVGVPGIVDHTTGVVIYAPNLEWHHVPLKTMLEQQQFGAPVFVENDGNLAALGEYYFGAAQGVAEMLYITVGVGLGGGMLRDGRLVRGVSGGAAEFGHMTIDPLGEFCTCGNQGCWETRVSQKALLRSVRAHLYQGFPSLLTELVGKDIHQVTIPMVIDAAKQGDTLAIQALTSLGRWMGIGIANLVNALNPALVVVGGVLNEASDLILAQVEEEIGKRVLECNRVSVRVVRAAHGADASVQGGLAIVYQYVLAQPTYIHTLKGGDALTYSYTSAG